MDSDQILPNDIALTVGELTHMLKELVSQSFFGLRVEGEISNFRPSSTGHWYFTLKDPQASISAVMFKGQSWRVPFRPADGDRVTVTGRLDIYEARGTYQIICDSMRKTGTGDILALLEERKREYEQRGYFDQFAKKPLPASPTRVGVVTSPTGAALRDILQILYRRDPSLDVLILPAPVQGSDAAQVIAQRIEQANLFGLADVLIVGRGGGSLEDLLPFSDPLVLEAIHSSTIPVVSAVGHEIDWALSDFVADMRAPTPSAAAELVSVDRQSSVQRLTAMKRQLADTLLAKVSNARATFESYSPRNLSISLMRKIENARYALDDSASQITESMQKNIISRRHALQLAQGQIHALSPLSVLARGYSIVTTQQGTVVTDVQGIQDGQPVNIRFAAGSAAATINSRSES